METLDLAVLAVLNFISVFFAVGTMAFMDRRRKRKIGNMIMEDLGRKAETDANFAQIIRKNFTEDDDE